MSCDCAAIAQLVERILGKDEVSSSNLDSSSSSDALKSKDFGAFFFVQIVSAVRVRNRAERALNGSFRLFCVFRKFMLDKRTLFRYNKARSGGKRRAKLERSWPGSSVG